MLKRKDKKTAYLHIRITPKLKKTLKSKSKKLGYNMSELIELVLKDFLKCK